MKFARLILLGMALAGSAVAASADSILLSLTELAGEYEYTEVSTQESEQYTLGGPKTTTVQIPETSGTITAVTVTIGGVWEETCDYDEASDTSNCWLRAIHFEGGCVNAWFTPTSVGQNFIERTFTGCDFSSIGGSERTFTAYVEPIYRYPFYSVWPDISVNLYGINVLYHVEESVPASPGSWSTMKSRWTQR